jgi:hypothetical protein
LRNATRSGKHHFSVVADDSRNEFTPIARNEYGDAGAEAMGATMGSPFPLIS